MSRIAICLSSDNNYAQHLGVTLVSILENKADDDNIYVYVLDGGISTENISKILDLKSKYNFEIEFINIDKKTFEKCPAGKKNHITLAAYYRLLLAELCPKEDKLLYLDVDIIVKSSLNDFFNTDITDFYFAGVSDCDEVLNTSRLGINKYCNSGVILLNLKKWREENITRKLFNWMEKNTDIIVLHDQDILNCTLQDGILYADKHWNVQVSKYNSSKEFVKILPEAKIIHYIGKHKPWHTDFKQYAKDEYFKYLRLTNWKGYESLYLLKLYCKMPLLLFEKFIHFIFCIEKQNGKKILQILGLKLQISNQ